MAAGSVESPTLSPGSSGAAGHSPDVPDLGSLKLTESVDSPYSDWGDGSGKGKNGPNAAAAVTYPQRAGEPDCTYFLKFGSCKFGPKCKFNHPARKKKGKGKGNGRYGEASVSQVLKEDQEVNPSVAPVESKDLAVEESHLEGAKQRKYEGSTKQFDMVPEERHKEKMNREPKVYYNLEEKVNREPKFAKEKGKELVPEATSHVSSQAECKYFSSPGGCKYGKTCKFFHPDEAGKEEDPVELNFLGLPLRPGEKECTFYMRTGSCKFSNTCKFHHPDPTAVGAQEFKPENQSGVTPPQNSVQTNPAPQVHVPAWPDQRILNEQNTFVPAMMPPPAVYHNPGWNGYQVPVGPYYAPHIPMPHFHPPMIPARFTADLSGNHQENPDSYPERPGEPDCLHFLKNGFCKFKQNCKYNHPKNRPSASPGGLSPLGLPLKPDQPICTFYDRFGVCKFGPACMYNHPYTYGAPMPIPFPPPAAGLVPAPFPPPAASNTA